MVVVSPVLFAFWTDRSPHTHPASFLARQPRATETAIACAFGTLGVDEVVSAPRPPTSAGSAFCKSWDCHDEADAFDRLGPPSSRPLRPYMQCRVARASAGDRPQRVVFAPQRGGEQAGDPTTVLLLPSLSPFLRNRPDLSSPVSRYRRPAMDGRVAMATGAPSRDSAARERDLKMDRAR